ncbi:SCO family protein [Paraconexibacter sp.]|uniref:SCO family protein n=1 Tax=Paraconexibacter sp. TaxID=2949640 RepID=UPI003563A66F
MAFSRLQLVLATVVACAFSGIVAVVLASGGTDAATDSAPGFRGAQSPDVPPMDFRLRDQDGRVASLASLRGNVIVLTFLYTSCEDTCPVAAQQIRGALDDLGHDVPALAISVDPANDTPAQARRFLLKQRLTGGRMRFLLGDRSTLAPIWKAYGIAPQKDAFDHSARVVLIDPRGRQRVAFPVEKLTPEDLAHDIARLEAEQAARP